MSERPIDWFECDGDDYPTEESIERLKSHVFGPGEAADFLVNQLKGIVERGIGYCTVRVERTKAIGRETTRCIALSSIPADGAALRI